MSALDRGSYERGFAVLAGVNLAVAGCAYLRRPLWSDGEVRRSVLLMFPFVQVAWSVPMMLAAGLRGRSQTCRGMALAFALTFLIGYGWWLWIANDVGFD